MKAVLALLFLLPVGSAQTFPPALRTPDGAILRGPKTISPSALSGGSIALASTFQVVDALDHHDDFWSNMLTGDADHDRKLEIVIRFVPVGGGGTRRFVFYEDDGSGNFAPVHTIPENDGGLLAIGDVDHDGSTDLFFERAVGQCNHRFVRWEASSAAGFPDHEVWSAPKEGNVVDMLAFLADVDGDGLDELVTSDSNFTCQPASLKVFESAPGDQMTTILDHVLPGAFPGNPVVADFDLDGRAEIVVADGSGALLVFEGVGNDTIVPAGSFPHPLFNSYQLALVDAYSPDGRPMLFRAGQMGSLDYRVQVYEMFADNLPTQINEFQVPNNCGASIPQIAAADLFGTRTAEIMLDRLCDPVPVYSVGIGGALSLFDAPVITESLEIVGTRKTPLHSGAIAIGTFPTSGNPQGKTLVLELQ